MSAYLTQLLYTRTWIRTFHHSKQKIEILQPQTNQSSIMTLILITLIGIVCIGQTLGSATPAWEQKEVVRPLSYAMMTQKVGQNTKFPGDLLHRISLFVPTFEVIAKNHMTMCEMVRERLVKQYVNPLYWIPPVNLDNLSHIRPGLLDVIVKRNQGTQAGDWKRYFWPEYRRRIEAVNKGPFGTEWVDFVPQNVHDSPYRLIFRSSFTPIATDPSICAQKYFFFDDIAETIRRLKKESRYDVVDMTVAAGPSFQGQRINLKVKYQPESSSQPEKVFVAWNPQDIEMKEMTPDITSCHWGRGSQQEDFLR